MNTIQSARPPRVRTVISYPRFAERLRALAKDHREGRITLDTYRKLRAPLLDCLNGGSYLADPQSTTLPHLQGRGVTAPVIFPPRRIQPPCAWLRLLKRILTLAIAAVLIVAMVVAGWWSYQLALARGLIGQQEQPPAATRPEP